MILNKKDMSIMLIFMFILQIIFIIIDPLIMKYSSLIFCILIAFSISCMLIIHNFFYKFDKKYWIYLILFIGFLLRNLYVIKLYYHQNQNDFLSYTNDGHLAYIECIANNWKLPSSNSYQFYHPPLFHFLAACYYKLLNVLGCSYERSLEALQFLPCIFSVLSMLVLSKIVNKLNINYKSKFLVNLFIAVFPTLIILSGSINNDGLLYLFIFLIIYYLILWYENSNWKNTIILALFTGLSVMTKFNGAIMAIPIMYVFIIKLIDAIKQKNNVRKLIMMFFVFGLISLPIGLWYQVRNFILFKGNSIYRPLFDSVSSYSYFKRFLSIDFKSLCLVFAKPFKDYNLFAYIVKSSLFGEFVVFDFLSGALIMVFLNVILIISSFLCMGKYLLDKKKHTFILNLFLIIWLTNMISYVIFNILYPFGCTMNFRYIVPTAFIGCIFLIMYLECNSNKIFSIVLNRLYEIFMFLSIILVILMW